MVAPVGGRGEPYKFLDPYEASDHDIFVARDREAQTLVADVISSRLVVLFARTGTGKTSLIKAGVRPRLEELDYRTFYVRVEHDPVAAVRYVLRQEGVPGLSLNADRPTLPEELCAASAALERPLVIFFDQFEEFFIRFSGAAGADRVAAFVGDIAALYRDRNSGVHVVFSMREEYFVEMDTFRSEIPSIFHNDSNLRLRPFSLEQALQAVVQPAHRRGVEIDDGLAQRIVDELQSDGVVEPAQLSIICDTLWREGHKRAMQIADFERLGGAEVILSRRLEEDVAQLSDEHLALLEQVLPKLRTDYGTKYLRSFDELAENTGVDREALDSLVTTLKDAHLVSESVIHHSRYVEWASDYLAERTDLLSRRARIVLLRRRLDRILEQAPVTNEGSALEHVLPLVRDELNHVAEYASAIELTPEEARLLLLTALVRGAPARPWWERAKTEGVDVWAVGRDVISDSRVAEPAENLLELLIEIRNDEAVALIVECLDEQGLESKAFNALARVGTAQAKRALVAALDDEVKAPDAIEALRRIGTADAIEVLSSKLREGGPTGLRAGIALDKLAREPRSFGRADAAEAALNNVLDARAEASFEDALREEFPARFWFDEAQARGVDVWATLRSFVTDPSITTTQAEAAVRLLHELEDPEALELLELAAMQPRLRAAAERALKARGGLDRVRGERAGAATRARATRSRAGSLGEDRWKGLLRAILLEECLPIIGPGMSAGTVPTAAEIARSLAYRYSLQLRDADDLARVSDALEVDYDRTLAREAVAEIVRSAGAKLSNPSEPHARLAQLPLRHFLSANFDGLLESALEGNGRSPIVEVPSWWDSTPKDTFDHRVDVSSERPLVVHLYGHASDPESLVLTYDDFLDVALRLGQAPERTIGAPMRLALAGSALLVIGLSPQGQEWRLIHRLLIHTAGSRLRRKVNVMVALPPQEHAEQEFIEKRLNVDNFFIYWGTAQDFTDELIRRWHDYQA